MESLFVPILLIVLIIIVIVATYCWGKPEGFQKDQIFNEKLYLKCAEAVDNSYSQTTSPDYKNVHWLKTMDYYWYNWLTGEYVGEVEPVIGFLADVEDSIMISFRGTALGQEWLSDIDSELLAPIVFTNANAIRSSPFGEIEGVPLTKKPPPFKGSLQFGLGWYNLYCRFFGSSSLALTILDLTRRSRKKIIICGHSLGSALAVLCAFHLAIEYGPERIKAVYTFASPKVGNAVLADQVNKLLGDKIQRVINVNDVIQYVPIGDFYHVGTLREIKYTNPSWNEPDYHSLEKDYIAQGKIEFFGGSNNLK